MILRVIFSTILITAYSIQAMRFDTPTSASVSSDSGEVLAQVKRVYPQPHRVYSLAFNHNGTQLAMGSSRGKAWIINVATGQIVNTIVYPTDPLHTNPDETIVHSLEFNQDGTQLVAVCEERIHITNAQTGTIEKIISTAIGGSFPEKVRMRDGTLLAVRYPSRIYRDGLEITRRNYDDHLFALLHLDVMNAETNELRRTINLPCFVNHGHFNQDGTQLAMTGNYVEEDDSPFGDDIVKDFLIDLASGDPMVIIDTPEDLRAIEFNHDGTKFAAGLFRKKALRITKITKGEMSIEHELPLPDFADRVRFSADEALLAAACLDDSICILDLKMLQQEK